MRGPTSSGADVIHDGQRMCVTSLEQPCALGKDGKMMGAALIDTPIARTSFAKIVLWGSALRA